jgi:hypothetical protein
MAQFFQKIEAAEKGGGQVEFLSNHPSPDNRIDRVNQEVRALGGVPRNSTTNSRDFDDTKRFTRSLSAAPTAGARPTNPDRASNTTMDRPSDRFVAVESSMLRIEHPDNWRTYGQGDAMTITPRGGLIDDDRGNQALAYGVIVSVFEPARDAYGHSLQPQGYGQAKRNASARLDQSTDLLIQQLRLSNRNLRVTRSREVTNVNGERALSTLFLNDSPMGGQEIDWLITVERPEGLMFLVFTAPEYDFARFDNAFQQMLRSVRFKRQESK